MVEQTFIFSTISDDSDKSLKTRLKKPIIDIERDIKGIFQIENQIIREFLAELFGTTLLVLFGCASVAQFKLRKEDPTNNPIFLTINLTFGFGLALAIMITCKTSGGHLNPAVSFASLLIGKMSLLQFFVYTCAQFIGAFLAAGLVFITYMDPLKALPNMYTLKYAGIFSTFPCNNLTVVGGIIDQTIGTFLLITVYLAMVDKRNNSKEDGLHWTTVAFAMGLAVCVIGMSFGYNSAYAINPARDFSPRLFSMIVGWGPQVFTAYNYFFWIPLIVPMLGSFLASLCYIIFINNNTPQ